MDGNLMAKRKRVEMELQKGKQIATRLQTLLHEPVQESDEHVSYEELAMQILGTFTTSLSELSSYYDWNEPTQAVAVDGNGSTCSAKSEKTLTPAVKDRRGCYKRRNTLDSWTTVTQTTDDGLAWRKYGQKKILNSKHPRCYFRCTHKYSQDCKATKQVQKQEEDPFMYQTTYINRHTCTGGLPGPYHNVDPDPVEPNIISFQIQPTPTNEESNISDPSTDPIWQDILVGSDHRYEYQDVGSSFHPYGSTSFIRHDMVMEVNKFDDNIIDNFQFDYLN